MAIQIHAKVTRWSVVKDSPYITTPRIKLIVGEIYCRNPTKYNGIFCAPIPNHKSGMAVAIPDPIKNKSVVREPVEKLC